ncbi:MAG: tRNA 2-thiouridine(34) synthase MnmA [Ruminococcaceae bacterium]|nr:tRNA 2-thiouridine(34) synthase MnmA [Oscillospiraceae bacterium]
MKKAIIAMSGGVDSSVAAYLIKQSGFDIKGVTLKLHSDKTSDPSCCTEQDIIDAKSICDSLLIPHEVINFTDDFNKKVIDNFVNTYIEGGTPNPCIECNRHIKFKKLLDMAKEENFDYVVTGHYAKVEFDEKSGKFLLKKAVDHSKDQSYVLYSLTQKQLSKILFPLGDMTKEEIRNLAESLNFVNAKKSDSQDICFVKDTGYAEFIEEYTGKKSKPGKFIDLAGNVLGQHKGIINYTIGQRKGLGLSLKEPMFVCEKDIKNNQVILGYQKDLFKDSLVAENVNFIPFEVLNESIRVTAKTRYSQKEEPATITPMEDGKVFVKFDSPQRAITKGQAVVFYDNDIVVGGGTIC